MFTKLLLVILPILICCKSIAQPDVTFIKSFDPNPQNMWVFDKGTNIWALGNYVYVINGYLNVHEDRILQIFKIDAETREIVKKIDMQGPQVDLAISERGGHCITSDDHILLTGEWRDYANILMRTFIIKIDKDLEVVWENYYPDLFEFHVYGDAIAETPSGDILLYLTEGKTLNPEHPWVTDESWVRILKVDALGNPILNKIIPDTFLQSVGYGHLARSTDGNYLLSSVVIGYYYHWLYGTYRNNAIVHKIDEDANPIWSRMINYNKFLLQEPMATALHDGGGAVMWSRDTFTSDPNIAFEVHELHRIDSEGNTLWRQEWNDIVLRVVYRVITATNGDILGCGFYQNDGKGKTWLFRATEGGELLWERHYSDSIQRPFSPQLEMLDICEMADGRIAATGIVFDINAVGSLNPNVGVLVVGADGCLEPGCAGLTQYVTGAFEPIAQSPQLPQLICSPNPASDFSSVKLPTFQNGVNRKQTLRCYNAQGIMVAEIPWGNTNTEQQIEIKNWSSGAYQLLFWVDNRPVCSGKIFVQH
jgi:hypothetical protein